MFNENKFAYIAKCAANFFIVHENALSNTAELKHSKLGTHMYYNGEYTVNSPLAPVLRLCFPFPSIGSP